MPKFIQTSKKSLRSSSADSDGTLSMKNSSFEPSAFENPKIAKNLGKLIEAPMAKLLSSLQESNIIDHQMMTMKKKLKKSGSKKLPKIVDQGDSHPPLRIKEQPKMKKWAGKGKSKIDSKNA